MQINEEPHIAYRTERLTPLTRLTSAFALELSLLSEEQVGRLRADYREREKEATQKRDSLFRSLVVMDALVAIVLSGKEIVLPFVGIATKDLPALLEISVALASANLYFAAFAFNVWLAYNQIYHVFCRREAADRHIDPDLIFAGEIYNELNIKLLQRKMNLWGFDWSIPGRVFNSLSVSFNVANLVFFCLIPIMHSWLIFYAMDRIWQQSELSALHGLFFLWVAMGHILALVIWFVPSVQFTFRTAIGPKPNLPELQP